MCGQLNLVCFDKVLERTAVVFEKKKRKHCFTSLNLVFHTYGLVSYLTPSVPSKWE